MAGNNFKRIWGMPLALTLIITFGLPAALLGTGIWHVFAWIALSIPLFVLGWYMFRRSD